MSEQDPNSGTYPKLFFWLTPLLACIFTLGLIEAALALLWPVPFVSEHNLYYIADPYTGYRIQPNSQGRFRSGDLALINSHGHRDDESSLRRPAGLYRILVLGDSFTQGSNVGQDQTYPQVLELLLSARAGYPVEVINAGVGGWGPFQYARYFEHFGHEFEPNLLLLGFFVGNDTFDATWTFEDTRTAVAGRRLDRNLATEHETTIGFQIALYSNLHLARLFYNRGRFTLSADELRDRRPELRHGGDLPEKYLQVQARRMRANHRPLSAATSERVDHNIAQIVKLRDRAASRGIPLVLALIPDENQINPTLARRVAEEQGGLERFDLDMPQKLLRERFADESIQVIDLLPAFRAERRRLYMNDTHWSPEGHRKAAEELLVEVLPHVLDISTALRETPPHVERSAPGGR